MYYVFCVVMFFGYVVVVIGVGKMDIIFVFKGFDLVVFCECEYNLTCVDVIENFKFVF